MAYVKKNAIAGREFSGWAEFVAHLVRWTREVADLRVHGTTCDVPLERFLRSEAQALQPLEAKPSFLAERELARIMHSDCCVEVEVNWYSAPQALIRQRVSVLMRDQQVAMLTLLRLSAFRMCVRWRRSGSGETLDRTSSDQGAGQGTGARSPGGQADPIRQVLAADDR